MLTEEEIKASIAPTVIILTFLPSISSIIFSILPTGIITLFLPLVFDDLSRLEQLKRSDETPLKSRVAEVLYRDKYETIVADMRADWSHLDVPQRNLKETKENGKDM